MAKRKPSKPKSPAQSPAVLQSSAVTLETVTADTASMTAQQVTATRATFAAYSGPTPHPDHLERYEQISPGSATKLIDITCNQSAHRMAMESIVIKGDNWRANAGLVVTSVLAFAALASATFLISTGHEASGLAILGMDITGVAGAFVYSSRSRRKERETKQAIKSAPAPKPPVKKTK